MVPPEIVTLQIISIERKRGDKACVHKIVEGENNIASALSVLFANKLGDYQGTDVGRGGFECTLRNNLLSVSECYIN